MGNQKIPDLVSEINVDNCKPNWYALQSMGEYVGSVQHMVEMSYMGVGLDLGIQMQTN